MTENRLILKTAYDLFTGRHSNFGLPLSALSLWVLPREEYLDAFGRACARLGRGVPSSFSPGQLSCGIALHVVQSRNPVGNLSVEAG